MVGLGLGPLIVGLLRDLLAQKMDLGAGEGLRWAIVADIMVGFVSAAIFASTRDLLRKQIRPQDNAATGNTDDGKPAKVHWQRQIQVYKRRTSINLGERYMKKTKTGQLTN